MAVVVNDDKTQLSLLAALLEKAGCETQAFELAEEALEMMDPNQPPDIIVSDLYMPGIDGWHFCRLLRSPAYADFNQVPILVVSATFAGDHIERIVEDIGADAFLPAPVDGNEFVTQVHALINGQSTHRRIPILIVEDTRLVAEQLKRAFCAHGFDADTAGSLREAKAAFKDKPYHLAILDYHLPDGTGDSLLEVFRAQQPDCVCLMMTTDPKPGLPLTWMKRGAAAYVHKPFDPEFLIELCDRAQRERSLLRAQDLLEMRTQELRESEATVRNKLKAILEPDGDIGSLNLADIIDRAALQDMMEDFYRFTKIGCAVVDMSGKVLVAVGWQDICTRFHRVHPETARNCRESDVALTQGIPEGTYKTYRCKNNMWDIATPITVQGKHLGNIFLGQFFYAEEEPDYEVFRRQARHYGFDETEYLAALDRAPRWSRETIDAVMAFYAKLARMLSSLSYTRIRLAHNLTRQKQVGEQLRASRENLRITLKSIGDGVISTDRDGRVVSINPVAEFLTGWSAEEVTGQPLENVFRIIHEETGLPAESPLRMIMRDGVTGDLARRAVLLARDGRQIPIAESGSPIRDDAGQISGVVLVFRDQIRERLERQALEESEARFRSIYDHMTTGVARVSIGFLIETANPAYCEMLGYTEEELIGKHLSEITAPETVEENLEKQRMLAEGAIDHFRMEKHFIHKDGHKIYGLLDASLVRNSSGAPIYFLGSVIDITDRKKAEEALRAAKKSAEDSELRFKALHNASFGGITIHDKGLILDCNQGLSEITGYSQEELIGMDGLLLIAEKSRQIVMDHILAEGETPYEVVGVRKNGEEYPLRLEARQIPYKGKVARVVEFRDVSARKQAEAERDRLEDQLRQSQKMESVGRLAGGVAHDFNNMLQAILGHTEMALEQADPSAPLYNDLQEIQKAAERSADLTRQLLAFARKQTIAPRVLDLNKTIEDLLTMLRRLIGEDVDLLWIPGNNVHSVKLDPSQLDQLLTNLFVNARDAIEDIGQITIETHVVTFDEAYCDEHAGFLPGEYAQLSVSDDGCGIDRETQEHLFEPFFTTKTQGKGTGLGLATVYGIVSQNNGVINVYSEPGKGTTFNVYLPRLETDTQPLSVKATPRNAQPCHETILLVEDESSILKMTTMMLTKLGYNVISATTPGEAIRLADEHSGEIDLLMTDVVMPEMNGRDLAKNLLSRHPAMRRLFMSGYTANVIAHRGVLDEGVHFVQKPFTRQTLASKVREALT
jgi:PAS domain S-box-containing protein